MAFYINADPHPPGMEYSPAEAPTPHGVTNPPNNLLGGHNLANHLLELSDSCFPQPRSSFLAALYLQRECVSESGEPLEAAVAQYLLSLTDTHSTLPDIRLALVDARLALADSLPNGPRSCCTRPNLQFTPYLYERTISFTQPHLPLV